MLVRDGEGVTRVAEVRVEGARTAGEADRIARTVAESPLVKTALHGGDPNWGRVLAAVGRAGVPLDAGRISIWIGDVHVAEGGAACDVRREDGRGGDAGGPGPDPRAARRGRGRRAGCGPPTSPTATSTSTPTTGAEARPSSEVNMKLWGGNYEAAPDAVFWEFNKSFPFDRRLVREEIAASRAWVRALARCGAIRAGRRGHARARPRRGPGQGGEAIPPTSRWTSRTCTASSRSGWARSSGSSPVRRTSAAAGTSRR